MVVVVIYVHQVVVVIYVCDQFRARVSSLSLTKPAELLKSCFLGIPENCCSEVCGTAFCFNICCLLGDAKHSGQISGYALSTTSKLLTRPMTFLSGCYVRGNQLELMHQPVWCWLEWH